MSLMLLSSLIHHKWPESLMQVEGVLACSLDDQWFLCPSYLVFELNNVWCGLKHLGSLECVNVVVVD